MTGKKPKNNTAATSAGSSNYFSPLQTIDDDDDEVIAQTNDIKPRIPPITILKCKIEEIHDICKSAKIKDYAIRKMSIGLKFFCYSKHDYDLINSVLNGKYQCFTHPTKEDRPYKALLFGLETQDPAALKKKLINMGLQCIDVKIVHKKSTYATFVIYVVYFQRKTITMKELRQKYSVIEYVKVKWDFQSSKKNRITQCHNCQMYGHGSSHCKVNTFCANCAGSHKTSECNQSVIKCANCNGPHKSTDSDCPSKTHYLNAKQRRLPINRQQNHVNMNRMNYNNSFPNALQQNTLPPTGAWQNRRMLNINNNSINSNNNSYNNTTNNNNNTNSGELFSVQELQSLTLELIINLRNCKSKIDQFEVITNLACKFLS